LTWFVIRWQWRDRWTMSASRVTNARQPPPFDRGATIKGSILLGLTVARVLFTSLPRDVVALAAAGVLLSAGAWPRAR
jgi:hypothetical protein